MKFLGKDGFCYKFLALVIYFVAPFIAIGYVIVDSIKRGLRVK